jgi:SAM-dependent methyltransferase
MKTEKVDCNLCGSKDSVLLFSATDYITKTEHFLVRCKQCGLAFVNPQPSSKDLFRFYPVLYYGDEPASYEKIDARSRFKKLRSVVQKNNGAILDIGCGKGLLLQMFKETGWNVAGIELSEESARYASEKLHIDVYTLLSDLEADNIDKINSFDVITFFHSLEHVKDPLLYVKSAEKLLKSDGIMIIEVPRFNSLYSKVFKDTWFHLDVPRHLYHFEDQTLQKMMNSVGLHVFKKTKYALMYDSFGALQSILNSFCSRYNLLNDINTKRINVRDIMKSGNTRLKADSVMSFVAQFLVLPLLFISAAFFALFNTGGTLCYYARKSDL